MQSNAVQLHTTLQIPLVFVDFPQHELLTDPAAEVGEGEGTNAT